MIARAELASFSGRWMAYDRSEQVLRYETRSSPYIGALFFILGAALIASTAATYWYLIWPLGSDGILYVLFAIFVIRLGGTMIYVGLISEQITTSIYQGRVEVVTRNLIRQRQFSFYLGGVDQFAVEEVTFLKLRSIWTVNLIPMRGEAQRLCDLKTKDEAENFRSTVETLFYSVTDQRYVDQNRYLH